MTKIVDVCRLSQPPRLSLNSRPTCFGEVNLRSVGVVSIYTVGEKKKGTSQNQFEINLELTVHVNDVTF